MRGGSWKVEFSSIGGCTPRTWVEVYMGRSWERSRGGRRRGAMGRTRGERLGWDGQRHSVLERLGSQDMREGLER